MKYLMDMSEEEKKDIAAATVVLTLAFGYGFIGSLGVVTGLLTAFVAVGIGFIFHELAHRTMARRYGAVAEFQASTMGLILALVFSFASGGTFIFAAPGAVRISSHKHRRWHQKERGLTLEETGTIAFAGPLINIMLAAGFLLLNAVLPAALFRLAADVNIFLALFNMLPMPPLDGAKVFTWDRKMWVMGFGVILLAWAL